MITVFVLYLVVLMGIVYYSSGRSKTNEDYVIGGKKISGFSLALSERATGESAWLLLGLTGHAYAEGWSAIWVAVGCVLGILFLWFFMAAPLQHYAAKTQALTVPGLFSYRFPGSEKKTGIISSVIIIFFFILYIAAQFSGAGKIFHDTFGIDPFWGMVIGSLLVTVYTMLGGFITVVATDAFQAVLMVVTCVVLPIIAFFVYAEYNPGGMDMAALRTETLPADYSAAGWLFILNGLSWAFGYTGQPQLLTRMMAMRNRKETLQARGLAVVWTILAYGGAFLIGIIGFRLVQMGLVGDSAAALADDSEKILPVMVVTLLNPILAGILLSGAVSAMMSTASSQLMVASSAISEDLFANLSQKQLDEKRMLRINKWLTLLVGLFAFLLAISMEDTVYGLVSYAWSGIGAAFGPAVLMLLFWKRFSRAGLYASLITGTVSAVVWKTFLGDITGVSERLASYVLAFICALFFSILFPEKKESCNEF
ncbi:sodium/proline symporter [Mangrovibacterium diazotrophicum]|uniref:Sodium/proline symporter n=1 Tax=Mangrovibacterium diazotrophicum TaxID=1261403 RepID=A0A419VVJ5_9BACT|nr:sodium/proline symporter [Mangrovibacterium diazotrophicum]RKD86190.1 sodium/proline symporter [Mangrovibacterium diazotrophicum]